MFGPSTISWVRELQELEMSQCLKCSLSLLIVYFISDSRLVFFFISLHLRILRPSWIDIISDIGSEVLENQMTLRDTTKKQGVKTMVWGFWVAISPLIPSTVHCGHGHCWPGCSVILISDDYRVRNVGTGVSEVPDYSLIRSVRP